MILRHCRVLASQTAESPDDISTRLPNTHVYEFQAPAGFEELIGRGILFTDDWCYDGVVHRIEILREEVIRDAAI